MTPCESASPGGVPDPIQSVRFAASGDDPQRVTVTIELAEHVAQCCISPESAYIEFSQNDHYARREFTLREHRPGYQLEATIHLPVDGRYLYHVVANILGRSLTREGTYNVE